MSFSCTYACVPAGVTVRVHRLSGDCQVTVTLNAETSVLASASIECAFHMEFYHVYWDGAIANGDCILYHQKDDT
jgi:hypothetical protein